MKSALFAAAFLTIISTASLAQNVSTETTNIPSTQAKTLARNARTPAEYLMLRNYYAHVAQVEGLKAAEEKQEWGRRAANPTVYARKYPNPVDSAHYLYDSYSENARVATAEARHYDELASSAR